MLQDVLLTCSMPTTNIMAWTVAVHDSVEIVMGTLNHQTQMFGALLNEVHRAWVAIDWLSTSGASSLQAVASTMDTDEDVGRLWRLMAWRVGMIRMARGLTSH